MQINGTYSTWASLIRGRTDAEHASSQLYVHNVTSQVMVSFDDVEVSIDSAMLLDVGLCGVSENE